MLPLSMSIRYTDGIGKVKTRSFNGVRKDLTDVQMKDFAYNSKQLTGFIEVNSAVLTTKRSLV